MFPKEFEKELLADQIERWKKLKSKTQDHRFCDCADCKARRRIGATLEMPYAGPVTVLNTKLHLF